MKLIIQIIFFELIFYLNLNAQYAIDAGGGYIRNSSYSASYAIGEIQTITLKNVAATRYASSGVIQPDPVTVTLTQDPLKMNFKLYPNPVSDNLKVVFDDNTAIEYKIYNLQGRVLSAGHLLNRELKLESLTPGVYLIEFYIKSTNAHQVYLITKI